MKKIIGFIILFLIVLFGVFYFTTDILKPTETLSDLEASKLANESYLDILVEIENYDVDSVQKYKLLEASMRIARELDLVKDTTQPVYLEYVPRETIHTIIYELTGLVIDEPIIEEDYYYLYDEGKDYYYIVPVGTDWIHYGKILHADKKGSQYTIECSCVQSNYVDDGSVTVYANMVVKLKKRNDYKYIKYKLESISCGDKVLYEDDTLE